LAEAETRDQAASRTIALARLAAGLLQGVVLYLLSQAQEQKAWPASIPALYAALLLVFAICPLIVVGGLGRMRLIPLGAWTVTAAAVLAVFGWHDIDAGIWDGLVDPKRLVPALQVFFFSGVFVFVGHHLVGPADESRRLVARYPVYFDWAWKDAVQIALSVAFVGVLWIALELGGALFALIGLDAVKKTIEQRWFAFPVTCVAFAAAVQLTDVRVALIRGVRTVGLVLLSWLLPVMTVIVLAFLLALPFTGLAPLFGTRSGAGTVLSASAALIVLLSAAYQDGETSIPVALRWAGRAAALALVPLVLIAADALWLRVGQYGLTPARIEAIACAVIAAGFAGGYAFGAIRRKGPWMRPLELTNVVLARAAMLAILLLFSPIADPARLAVDDQVGRLLAGKTAPGKFDFDFLTYKAGRYGSEALARLAALKGSPRNVQIAALAVAGQQAQHPEQPLPAATLAQRFTVYPQGATLPASFLGQDWLHGTDEQPCFTNIAAPGQCDAYVLDIDGDGAPEVLLTQETGAAGVTLDVYKQSGGRWSDIGQLYAVCADSVAALRAGQVKLVPKTGVDVELAGRRLTLTPSANMDCGPAAPAAKAAKPVVHGAPRD
jgi:hypothetical protein